MKKNREARRAEKEKAAAIKKRVREGVDVKRPIIKVPPMITEITDDIVGKRVWYFTPNEGVGSVLVTALHSVQGRDGKTKWGLWYDKTLRTGKVQSRIFWLYKMPVFPSRQSCERWIRVLLEKSKSDAKLNRAKGLE